MYGSAKWGQDTDNEPANVAKVDGRWHNGEELNLD
jgi:hypothetical protein